MLKLKLGAAVLCALALAGCGGGGSLGGGDTTGGGLGGSTTGGNTGTGVPATLTIEAAQDSIVADGQSTSLLTATLQDTSGVPISGATLNFETNAGSMTAASATTNATGQAITRLKAGTRLGRATVTVREPRSGLSSSANVVFRAGAAASVTIEVAPKQVRPAGTASVAVNVSDANGLPVSGELVQLAVNDSAGRGRFAATVLTTDENGRASTTYQAGPAAGTDILRASIAAAGLNATEDLIVSASATTITGITLSLGAESAVADGEARTSLTAKVVDSTGAPVPGSTVNFNTTGGTLLARSAQTGVDGIAQVALQSPVIVGEAEITASTAGLSDTKTISFVPGAVDRIALSAAPLTVPPGGTSAIRATAFDAKGNRVPGVTISFSLPAASVNNGGRFSAATVVTDANGEAATQYIAPSSGSSDTINAQSASGKTAPPLQITISSVASIVTGLSLEAGSATVPAGQNIVLRAVVQTTGSRSGIPVNFSASAGVLSATSANTDATGVAAVTLTAPRNLASIQLSAKSGNYAAQSQVQVVAGAPVNASISIASSPVAPGGNASIIAQLLDINDNPVSGQVVQFRFASSADNQSGATITPASAVSDANGYVSVNYVAGKNRSFAADTVTLSFGDNRSRSATIQVDATAKPVGSIAFAVANASMTIGATQTVVATVRDSNGNLLPGQTVTFAATAGDFAPSSGLTGADGRITSTYTASIITGVATLTATSGGYSASQNVALVSGAATSVQVSASPKSVAPGRVSSIVAVVRDGSNNPVANHSVVFSSDRGKFSNGATSINATTDASGVAVQSFTAPTAGLSTIVVTAKPENRTGSDTVNVDVDAAVIGGLTVTALQSSVPAGSTSPVRVRAQVTDSQGNALEGVTVHFRNTTGTPYSGDITTDSNGRADFFVTAASVPGMATVTATAGGFSGSANINFTAGAPKSVVLTLSPASVAINGATTVRAKVTDQAGGAGNPVAGVTVNFSVPTNSSGGVLASTSALTDANGVATTTYTAGNALPATGNDVIQADVAGVSTPVADRRATLEVVVQIGRLTLSAADGTLPADAGNTTTLTATLVDQGGRPIKGRNVVFTTNAGTIAPAAATTTGVPTDGNGRVFVTLSAANIVGNATVTANVPGSTAATVVQFVAGAPDAVTLTASPTTVAPGAQSVLVATLKDEHGNPVPDATVLFSGTGAGTVTPVSAVTNAIGEARSVYTAGSVGSSSTITADAGNGIKANVTVSSNATAVLVGRLTLTLGASSVVAGFPGGVTLNAVVNDTSGAAVPGKTVRFHVTDGSLPGGGTTDTAATDSNGVARLLLTLPTYTTPVLTVRAEADGFIDEKSLAVVAGPAVAGAGASVISANPSTLLADGTSTTTVTVILKDANGNALPDGTNVTLQTTAGTLSTVNETLSNGRASFMLRAPNAAGTAQVRVPAVSGLSTTVSFTGASTGDPAALRFTTTATQIAVAGVGQSQQSAITVRVLDSAGNPIDESKYGDATLNNLQARFITRPNGGETLSGTAANGTIVTNDADGVLNVRTTNGVATLTLQSGTISGIVEVQFSVRNFANTGIAASGMLPQVSIASGAPESIVFTGPISNAIENLTNGNYRLQGKVDVRDRYGNFVPDGTVVNFAVMDSVIVHDSSGSTNADTRTLTRAAGPSLITRRCAVQPVPNGEATNCVTDGSLGDGDFLSRIVRNDIPRGIRQGDLVLVRDTQDSDKRRSVNSVPTSAVALAVQSNYLGSVSNATFWVGASMSGAAISGFAEDGTTMKPGTGVVKNGLAEFRLDYPANVRSILTGCYGYHADGSYDRRDLRDAVPQSRQVIVSADAGARASAVNAGDFCFKAIAGGSLTPDFASIALAPGASRVIALTLRDGGDTIPLPYLPVSCAVKVPGKAVLSAVTVGTNSDGDPHTNVNGVATVTITRHPTASSSLTDTTVVTCVAGDASVDITVLAD